MYIILISSSLQTFAIFLVPSALTLRHSSTLSSAASTAVYAAQWITASGFASFITLWQAPASVMSISSTSTPMPSIPFAASSSITSWPNCPFTPVTRTLIRLNSSFFHYYGTKAGSGKCTLFKCLCRRQPYVCFSYLQAVSVHLIKITAVLSA